MLSPRDRPQAGAPPRVALTPERHVRMVCPGEGGPGQWHLLLTLCREPTRVCTLKLAEGAPRAELGRGSHAHRRGGRWGWLCWKTAQVPTKHLAGVAGPWCCHVPTLSGSIRCSRCHGNVRRFHRGGFTIELGGGRPVLSGRLCEPGSPPACRQRRLRCSRMRRVSLGCGEGFVPRLDLAVLYIL